MRRHLEVRTDTDARNGSILPFLVIAMPLLLGALGLVIDGGLLMSSHRSAQNAADAAARAAAQRLRSTKNAQELRSVAEDFVFIHNGIARDEDMPGTSQVVVNCPPATGPHAGRATFVEVVVTCPLDTFFIHTLGSAPHQHVSARAVAGYQRVAGNAGVVILAPEGNPGLTVSGADASLSVDGGVVVYSQQAGVNEFGVKVGTRTSGHPAAEINGAFASVHADFVEVSGGIDDQMNFAAPKVGELNAGTLSPPYDPFLDGVVLATPDVANGVVDMDHGQVAISRNSRSGVDPPNYYDPSTQTTTLFPGLYSELRITGGNVVLTPGIYILRPAQHGGHTNTLAVNGGLVNAEGVMFYNTGSSYSPADGGADAYDVSDAIATNPDCPSCVEPVVARNERFGGIEVHGPGLNLSPIDSSAFDYYREYSLTDLNGDGFPGDPVGTVINGAIAEFDDMVIYQRRANTNTVSVTDGAQPPDGITGTMYAKWAEFSLSGHGTYNFRIVTGTLSVTGNARVTVPHSPFPVLPKVWRVALVE